MSRHPVTVTKGDKADPNAVIGYDPPLRTFFLQAFPDPETEENELWLGMQLEEFPSLESIVVEARAQGYDLSGMSKDTVVSLIKESSTPTPPGIAEQLGLVR
ncbi:hypothetical protein CFBP4996_26435 (plasmid) [Agrobacterium leguminum]|uniref:hypothetical protein n=1 Tax=Agrobacterium leguminum TaxID=2792015 RepID=UPI0010C96DD9|nr:hypothetical protein [Agrobacterium leguminum]WFS69533.1 hypothetical protein CFBP4996_26435 [Agrobacterium leguminum]